ncbi:uncharacterized protein LOC126909592 isoform X1 [Daktulosphaira vitifoliae]|uniref:uncharacterized protein LOC126909592 isoform X1 n=1 Tax=Daktulosphaira vitifoliae TaxID=58002 RepID=UPI0021A9DFB0|nr:uncharacterized protein LOC126909592 isoform X1 [Daktulosphaira vitifoliae]
MANLNINDFEQINNDEINTFLNTLSDNIISRRIYPEEMSQEFIEFFKLDKFIIKDKLNECFKIFQSNLFAIKKPKYENSDDLESVLRSRIHQACKILQDCKNKYGINKSSDMNHYETVPNDYLKEFQESTIEDITKIVSGEHTPYVGILGINYFHFAYNENPFIMHCCVVYYTYLVTDDSTLNQNLGTSDRTQ